MNFWNSRFSSQEYIYGIEPNEFFRDELLKLRPGSILLAGEGEGRNAKFAIENKWKVLAVDASIEGKKKAIKLIGEESENFKYEISNLVDFDFGTEKFDAVGMSFLHLPSSIRKEIHQKLVKSLKTGGHIIMEAFDISQLEMQSGGPKSPDMLYTKEMLENDFEDCKHIILENTKTILSEGNHHKGEANVVRYLGQKL